MKILMLSQYFHPEVGATQTRVYEFAKHLAQNGHQVTVISEFPNHPSGIIPEEYKGRFFEKETMDGFEVLRVWVLASPKKSAIRRMCFYISYMVMAVIGGFLDKNRYDMVFATSPPLFVGVSGYILSKLKRAYFVFDIRDLWPAAAVALGELSSERIIRLAEKMELFLYRHSSAVVAVTEGFAKYISDLGIRAEKIHHIPNGTIPEFFAPSDMDVHLRSRLGLSGKFVVTFAGNHGIAQALDTILESAKQLRENRDIIFLFIGDGPVKQSLIDLKEKQQLANVVFHNKVPLNEIAKYINMSDALLVPLRRNKVFHTFIPSKMFDFMCCGKPIILSVDGEAREILEGRTKAGRFVPPEDPDALSEAILWLRDNPEMCKQYGQSGREFVLQGYVRKQQAQKLENVMYSLIYTASGHRLR